MVTGSGIEFCSPQLIGSDASYTYSHSLNSPMAKLLTVQEDTSLCQGVERISQDRGEGQPIKGVPDNITAYRQIMVFNFMESHPQDIQI